VRRRTSHRGFAASQRRKLTWGTTVESITLSTTPTATLVDLLSGYKAAGGSTQGITIMRTHIQVAVQTSSPDIGSGSFLGLIVGTNDDTPVQLNAQAEYDDWMLYRACYAMGTVAGGTGFEHTYEIDIRAKRKMQELNQVYYLVLEALDTNITNVAFSARTLLALP